jgi:hypothetical protein
MPIDRTLDYQIRLDAIERRSASPGRWGRRFWLLVAATLGVWALGRSPGEAVGLGLIAFAFLLWGLVPHYWTLGPPLPPEMVPPPDPDDARIALAANVCWWAGFVGNSAPLSWAWLPLERERLRRDLVRHPERPRPRYWLRLLVTFLVLMGLMVWGLAWMVAHATPAL